MPKPPPQTIYLQWYDGSGEVMPEVTWSSEKINDTDSVYTLSEPGRPWVDPWPDDDLSVQREEQAHDKEI